MRRLLNDIFSSTFKQVDIRFINAIQFLLACNKPHVAKRTYIWGTSLSFGRTQVWKVYIEAETFTQNINQEKNMYFPFHRSKMGQESDDDGVPISPNFPTSSGSTDKCDESVVEGRSSKKAKIDSDNLKLVPAKFQDHPTCESKKSPLPYIGMIAEAINSSPDKKMVLSEIYTYMEQHFFQYLSGKPRWRNTVRHNLSFHRCFVKCECSRRGNRSHFWSIHPEYIEQFKRGNFTKTLSPPREQINSSHYRPEQQIFRRNPSENFHRFFTNSSCENYLHYEGVPPTSPNTFFQVISPSGSTSLHPHHDLRSFPLVQSSSSRGISYQ